MKKNLIKHGNKAKVTVKSEQLNGKFYTNIITCNKTLSVPVKPTPVQ